MKIIDLKGKKFTKLTVVRRIEATRDGSKLWECKCDCGTIIQASTRHLNRKNNNIKSCGCISKERIGPNHPDWKGVGEISADWWHSKILRNFKQKSRSAIEIKIDMEYAWNLFLKQNRKCALTGINLTIRNRLKYGNASLDRIDSSKGYIEDNVQWVHKDINMMKRTYDQNYFIEMCKKVAKNKNSDE